MKKRSGEPAETIGAAIQLLLKLPLTDAAAFVPRTRAEQIAARIVAGAAEGDAESLAAVLKVALSERARGSPAVSAPKITVVEEYGHRPDQTV